MSDTNIPLLIALAVGGYLLYRWGSSGLDAIPTLGYSNPILSYIDAYRYYTGQAPAMIQEGYEKFPNAIFKIANVRSWIVVVTGGKLVDDIRNAPTDTLSFIEGLAEMTHTDYTFGTGVRKDTYHAMVLKGVMTRQLGVKFPELNDEVEAALQDNLKIGEDWTPVLAYPTFMEVVTRAAHRVFVGIPLCRDPELSKLGISFALHATPLIDTMTGVPQFMRPIIGLFMSNMSKDHKRVLELLGPTVAGRFRQEEEYGQDWDKPNDLLQWLMDESKGPEHTVENVTLRFLPVQFGAIHTMTMGVAHALYYLAASPQYIAPLREEAERVTKEHGWTKTAMQELYKMDSFYMESQRLNPIGTVMMDRRVMKPYTLSNGVTLPKGTMVSVAVNNIHTDDQYYPNARQFDPWRFSRVREAAPADKKERGQWAGLEKNFYSFGSGKNSCPGRFLAAHELKCIMAHIVLNYDVKLEDEGVRPPNTRAGARIEPSFTAEVLFKRRAQ